jgi:predicted aldo/keto reductase-like oxidoreductase
MKKAGDRGRRRFLKAGVTGLAGITILPALRGTGSARTASEEKKEHKIVKRKLGRTGLELPVVSVGAGAAQEPEIIAAALDMGIVHLDTANSYGRGRNEEMIGGVIKGRPRDSFVITTKVTGAEDRRTGLFREGATAEMFIEKFETSLERLGVDHVDILMIHSVATEGAANHEPFLEAITKMKKEGKTRLVGVSTHANEPEVIEAVAKSDIHDVVLTAYNFRQPHLAEMHRAMEMAAAAGKGIIAMKTQAGVWWDESREKMIDMKAALKWAISNKNVHTTIPGIDSIAHLEENVSVMDDLELSPEDKKALQVGLLGRQPGLYCDQCGECRKQCVAGVDIPTMMRCYMYVYGYRDLAKAKEAMAKVDLPALPCSECGRCRVRCSMGFDVRRKLTDVARLRDVPEEFVV